ncbi:thioredoxin family protein [Antarctobacter heliothermus]|uniref:Small redox-active disulfide protein 2 n=1 Tax=Antarctobacter heliothermus TaxID=74033 RepID=A0A239ID14_9RHOB|nr:thioredoxin family protein [Antarctobacter heliothermus]SNS91128.1 small redox-active disulfide protein 2 [Antarctobacter heliothermus]
MKTVKVYGPGCKRCDATEALVKQVASDLGITVEIEKVSDPKSMAMAGVMSTPAVSVDGKMVHAGGLPEAAHLKQWLSA